MIKISYITFVAGTKAKASEVNGNFDQIITDNGSLFGYTELGSTYGTSKIEFPFTTDSETDTNCTYDATDDSYLCTDATGTIVSDLNNQTPDYEFRTTFTRGYVKYFYKIYEIVDEVNDESVNSTYWGNTSGTITLTETGTDLGISSYMQGRQSANEATARSGSFQFKEDLKDSTDTYAFGIFMDCSAYQTGSATAVLRLTDGSNTVNIISTTGADVKRYYNEMYFDWDNDLVYLNGTSTDISSLTGSNIYLEFAGSYSGQQTGRNSYYFVQFFYMRKLADSPTTTITQELSVDGESNYTAVDSDTNYIELTTNTGDDATAKITMVVPSTEIVKVKGVYSIALP